MQKILVAIAAVILMASCMQKKGGNFTIKGTIKNAPANQTIYVEKVSLQTGTNDVYDSLKLKPSGEYSLKGKGTEEGLYMLSLDRKPFAIFINDNAEIHADIDLNSSHFPAFSGSPASKTLYEFITFYSKEDSLLQEVSDKINTIRKTNPADSTIHMLQTLGMSEMKALNQDIENIIKTSNSPALICFALDKARGTMELKDVSTLVLNATNRFKQHSGLAIIKTQVTEGLAQQPAQNQGSGPGLTAGQQAPDLTMPGINGKPISISSFKGKYLLVDFWASWCGPCRAENPNVVAAYNKYKDKNFTILGVSLDQDKASWMEAIKKDGLAWNHMSDLKYWNSEAVTTYQFDGIPFNVLVDPTGKIIATSLRGADLEAKLDEVLK